MFFRLLCRAPVTVKAACDLAIRRFVGTGIAFFPLKYCPVSEFFARVTWAGVPAAVISPPRSPAPGPKSSK